MFGLVRETLHRWQEEGLGGYGMPLTLVLNADGKQKIWSESCLRDEQRTYNSHQLAQKLKTERNVTLNGDHLRQILKKRG